LNIFHIVLLEALPAGVEAVAEAVTGALNVLFVMPNEFLATWFVSTLEKRMLVYLDFR
jgi:hypothetical protein